MPTTKQKYVLSQRHQLIDLNKTYKNFKLQFQVNSTEPNKDFHAIVLNQEQLDGTTELQNVEMKLAKGRIGGTIVADNDKYQNYFLVLKSILPQDNTEVEVTTTIEEVEPKPPVVEEQAPSEKENEAKEEYTAQNATSSDQASTARSLLRTPWFWLLVFILVAGGAYYYFTIYKKSLPVDVSAPKPILTEQCPTALPVTPTVAAASIDAAMDTSSAATTVARGKKAAAATAANSSKQTLYNKLSEIA